MIVVLSGPIKYWWNESWETPAHLAYKAWRESLAQDLLLAGHTVYRPYEAIKGQWDERAQSINNAAIKYGDVVIVMTPKGVRAEGTQTERAYASYIDKVVLFAPPGDYTQIAHLLVPLEGLDERYGRG